MFGWSSVIAIVLRFEERHSIWWVKKKLKKALAVEDDPVSLKILKVMLESWGYEVTTAVNGANAFAKFLNDPNIQMVVSDWMIPRSTESSCAE